MKTQMNDAIRLRELGEKFRAHGERFKEIGEHIRQVSASTNSKIKAFVDVCQNDAFRDPNPYDRFASRRHKAP